MVTIFKDHVLPSRHLKAAPHDAAISGTFLGQAHIAGTGPEGKTCRECQHWRQVKKPHYAFSHKEHAGELKRQNCDYPTRHKAKRKVPPTAGSCRFFAHADNPPPLKVYPEPKPEKLPGLKPKRSRK